MKQNITFILFLFVFASLQAEERIYTVDNIPKVRLQNKMQYVSNPTGILSQEACTAMDEMLYNLEQKTGIETVVIAVPSIGEEDCFEFTHRLFDSWGVGKKGKDNGLVILLVTDQRCVQFCTGYGLEGDLPDAISKRIQTKNMIPHLSNGDWNNGMIEGVRAVCARLDGSMSNDSDINSAEEEGGNDWIAVIVIVATILFSGGIAFFVIWRAGRCPNCGKHNQLQRTQSRLVSNQNGVKIEDVTYICHNCRHTLTRRQQTYDSSHRNRSGGGGGPIIGGGFGGGGGSRGGSFGGGRSGGGGAGSRF